MFFHKVTRRSTKKFVKTNQNGLVFHFVKLRVPSWIKFFLLNSIFFVSVLFLSACSRTEPAPRAEPVVAAQPRVEQENPCPAFDRLNTKVRDGRIDRTAARDEIKALVPKLRAYYASLGGKPSPADEWIFPLEGYDVKAVGGTNGEGYIPKGYEYFDGNKHLGHPAQDIFIMDRDQDTIDDRTGKPVKVRSVRNGIVVAAADAWTEGSELRGGKYLYVFDPSNDSLFYYAHNNDLLVKVGDLVRAGQAIATVGRTGKNAFAKRSPSHLHLMWLVIEDGQPRARDVYPRLKK